MGRATAPVLAAAAAQITPYVRILTGDEIPFVDDGQRDGHREAELHLAVVLGALHRVVHPLADARRQPVEPADGPRALPFAPGRPVRRFASRPATLRAVARSCQAFLQCPTARMPSHWNSERNFLVRVLLG